MISTADDDVLDRTFAALANSTRRSILARLAEGEAGVNELAEPFDLSLPAVSKHIKVLEEAGLITRTRHAQYRPCQIDPEGLALISAWTELHQRIWAERFDQLDDYVTSLQAEQSPTINTRKRNES